MLSMTLAQQPRKAYALLPTCVFTDILLSSSELETYCVMISKTITDSSVVETSKSIFLNCKSIVSETVEFCYLCFRLIKLAFTHITCRAHC